MQTHRVERMLAPLGRVVGDAFAPTTSEDFGEQPDAEEDEPSRYELRHEVRTDAGVATDIGQLERDAVAKTPSATTASERIRSTRPAARRGQAWCLLGEAEGVENAADALRVFVEEGLERVAAQVDRLPA